MKRVAVIEDNADNRLLLSVILGGHYEVTEYESGPDALRGLGASLPDIILLDISLPEMDGIEILGKLRDDQRLSHIPVIALTAHASSYDRERFLGAGFDDYVTKPIVDEAVLLDAIAKYVDV